MKSQSQLRTLRTADGAAILDLSNGVLSTLNHTGGYIWQALQQGITEDDIVLRLASESGQPMQLVAVDVHDFLAMLRKHKLLP